MSTGNKLKWEGMGVECHIWGRITLGMFSGICLYSCIRIWKLGCLLSPFLENLRGLWPQDTMSPKLTLLAISLPDFCKSFGSRRRLYRTPHPSQPAPWRHCQRVCDRLMGGLRTTCSPRCLTAGWVEMQHRVDVQVEIWNILCLGSCQLERLGASHIFVILHSE